MITCKLMTVVKFMLCHATNKLLKFFLNTLQILRVDCYWLDVHSTGPAKHASPRSDLFTSNVEVIV